MGISSINPLNSSYIQSMISSALQSAGVSTNSTSSTTSPQDADYGQLSPFAQILNTLQQLQQSNPTEYQQVTSQIASALQSAAQTASSQGNSSAANALKQLATVFGNASQAGQLPNISALAQALGDGYYHHHDKGGIAPSGASSGSPSTSESSATSTSSSSSSSNPFQQLLAENNATQNESLNPLQIITSTLASAAIGSTSNS